MAMHNILFNCVKSNRKTVDLPTILNSYDPLETKQGIDITPFKHHELIFDS